MKKIYIKRGTPNYKEKRLIAEIEKAIGEGATTEFDSAKNFEELKALHSQLTITDVDYEESGINKNEEIDNEENVLENHKNFRDGISKNIEPVVEKTNTQQTQGAVIDPFNEGEVIVRDYVADNGFKENEKKGDAKTTFEEPSDFKSSFEMPKEEDEKDGSHVGGDHKKEPKKQHQKPEPINPKFDDMSNAKKKRSTKKFAKLIIDGACLLAEKGCIWWTTKDITEDKLAQYQIEDTMDLGILLSLEDGQRQPVIQWFRARRLEAEVAFKVSETDKEDLYDSLYEVMLEKGIAPTPMQELLINVGKVFLLDMGVKAFQLSQQINNVLGQLKEMKGAEKEARAVPQTQDTRTQTENTTTTTSEDDYNSDDELDDTNTDVNPATTNQLAISE
jgi:hypothetical protein